MRSDEPATSDIAEREDDIGRFAITDYIEAATAATTPGLERGYRLDEVGTLEHLLAVCQDAALGSRLALKIHTRYDRD